MSGLPSLNLSACLPTIAALKRSFGTFQLILAVYLSCFFRSVVVKFWADVFFLFLIKGMLYERAEETHIGKEAQLERKVIFFMPKLVNFFWLTIYR